MANEFSVLKMTADATVPIHQPTRMQVSGQIRRDLRSSLSDGALFSFMVGSGETYLAAFALVLGSGELSAAWLATIPKLTGAFVQLLAPWAIQRIRSNRRWVVGSAVVQATSLLSVPLVIGSSRPTILLFLVATIYWAAGLASGPAWNTWMEGVVPKRIRVRFFAARSRVCQASVLAGFVLAGILLQLAAGQKWQLTAFAALFVTAAVCRFLSAYFLYRHSEPSQKGPRKQSGLLDVLSNLRGHSGGKLLVYLLLVQVTVQTAGPFFTPYLLAELKVSYLEFMLLIGAAFAGKVWAMPWWGSLAKSWGPQWLLRIGGVGIIPFAALWTVSSHFWYLLVIEIFSGIIWSAYELAILLMFFEAIPHHERTSLLTIYNVGNAVSLVIGSLVGGTVLMGMGVGGHFEAHWLGGWSPYLLLFGCSTALRLLTLPLLFGIPAMRFQVVIPALRFLAVRPAEVAADPPVLPSMPDGD